MHLVLKTCAPSATVPDPAGNPVPSGGMLTSQLATSASVAGTPRPGPCGTGGRDARAAGRGVCAAGGGACAETDLRPATIKATAAPAHLDVDIANLPVGR